MNLEKYSDNNVWYYIVGTLTPGLNDTSYNAIVGIIVESGGWSDWSRWSVCAGSCSRSRQQRSRTCTKPYPLNGGATCIGSSVSSQTCVNTSAYCSRAAAGQANVYRSYY